MTEYTKGQLIKSIRVSRGLRISDVADNLSISTISKFENGQSDISLENFSQLLKNLKVDPAEFCELLSDLREKQLPMTDISNDSFEDRISRLSLEQDVETLRSYQLQLERQYAKTDAPFYKLRAIVVTATIIRIQHPHSFLSKPDAEFVKAYLLQQDTWYRLEYMVYNHCVPFIQTTIFEQLYPRLLLMHFSTKKHQNQQNLFSEALYKTASSLYHRHKYADAVTALDRLNEQHLPEAYFLIRLQSNLLKTLCQFKIMGSKFAEEDLNSLLKATSKISPAIGQKWRTAFNTTLGMNVEDH